MIVGRPGGERKETLVGQTAAERTMLDSGRDREERADPAPNRGECPASGMLPLSFFLFLKYLRRFQTFGSKFKTTLFPLFLKEKKNGRA